MKFHIHIGDDEKIAGMERYTQEEFKRDITKVRVTQIMEAFDALMAKLKIELEKEGLKL